MDPKLKILWERIRVIPPMDAGHDFSHVERVMRDTQRLYSKEIQKREKRELTPMEANNALVAALLHDCVPVTKDSPLRKEGSRLSSEKAKEWLTELDWGSKESIHEIGEAIRAHSFSANYTPTSLLGDCLQDADRLEALGAIGLYRVIATGVAMGTRLFDPEDPWAKSRELDDRKFSLDHFFTKLLKLPESFRTPAAREEANQRADFLRGFVEQLKKEI